MLPSSAYAISPKNLRTRHDEIVAACRQQGIERIAIAAAMTGKLYGTPAEMREHKQRLERDGLQVFALVYPIGHPAMATFYDAEGRPPTPALFYDGSGIIEDWSRENLLLPRGWQYAVNEFGNPVYCSACPDQACRDGNVRVMRQLATVFDEIWYDDDYRTDGDQGAGSPCLSTASCYCDRCLADLSRLVGRTVRREDILADQALHDAWIDQKTDQLGELWRLACEAGRQVNPRLAMGLMIRWGGEERDGLDLAKLLPHFGKRILLRLGEGHFGDQEYARPASQVIEHLAATYHVSWFPRSTPVLSETTYVGPMTRQRIVKKAALALAAGAEEISYCPCVTGWIAFQPFMGEELPALARWGAAFTDKAAAFRPIAILRAAAAGRGDRRPVQRVRDRQPFPLFGLAGLCSTVVRQGGWRDQGDWDLVALTGRTVWDCKPGDFPGKNVILDGHALLEHSPWNAWLGLDRVAPGLDGRVAVTGGALRPDGLLLRSPSAIVVPWVWQDVPEASLPALLADLRRVVGELVKSAVVKGDPLVLPVHHRYPDHDAIMLVNLTGAERRITLRLTGARTRLADQDGKAVVAAMTLAPDEIRVVIARET